MMDRRMLELAARAAGYVVESHHVSGGAWVYPVSEVPDADDDYPGLFLWRPREDDGDALRLAVKLGIEVWRVPGKAMANGPRISPRISEPNGSDIYAATRRAITRAAAEIGKQMEVSNG